MSGFVPLKALVDDNIVLAMRRKAKLAEKISKKKTEQIKEVYQQFLNSEEAKNVEDFKTEAGSFYNLLNKVDVDMRLFLNRDTIIRISANAATMKVTLVNKWQVNIYFHVKHRYVIKDEKNKVILDTTITPRIEFSNKNKKANANGKKLQRNRG
jgi:hypothetical protein